MSSISEQSISLPRRPATDEPYASVVIPCLNEAETIAECVRRAWEALERAGIDGEVIVTDNGS